MPAAMLKAQAKHANFSVIGCKNQHKSLYVLPSSEDVKTHEKEMVKLQVMSQIVFSFLPTLRTLISSKTLTCMESDLCQYNQRKIIQFQMKIRI